MMLALCSFSLGVVRGAVPDRARSPGYGNETISLTPAQVFERWFAAL